jgi:DNA-binding GntR family transcriptional regulator
MERVSVPLLRDEAYDRLRQAITEGELAPGQQLRPDELADELGLSRMPIREALSRLADDGLVETRPRSGTRVAPLRLDDTSQALAVITAMHALAVSHAVSRLTPVHIERLQSAEERFADAVSAGDYEAAIAADDDFHGLFIEVAANRPLSETVLRYMPTLRRAEALRFGSLPGRRSIAAHAEILRATWRGDTAAAVRATQANWNSLATQIQQSMADIELEGRNES